MISVMWFRRDLRIEDNTALKFALENSDSIILYFHINQKQLLTQKSKNQEAFFSSVAAFQDNLKNKGVNLLLYYGDLEAGFKKLKETYPNWTDIYFNVDESGYGEQRDLLARKILKKLDVNVNSYHDHHLHSADEIMTNNLQHYQVYSAYYKKWEKCNKPLIQKTNFDAKKIFDIKNKDTTKNKLLELAGISNRNSHRVFDSSLAQKTLLIFIENNLKEYDKNRDFFNLEATSKISRYLRSGEISIRTVYHNIDKAPASKGKEVFIKELAWRDFYNMVNKINPNQKNSPIKPEFGFIEWDNNQTNFDLWKSGKTGFPIVDAAMRQLKSTGQMHNRLRMITASFLIKNLLIDWRWGEKYFEQQLIDYDSASNSGNWQWVASTGTDSAPYFRIFNPTLQSERFDPKGEYIKKWLPELSDIIGKKIHEPSLLTSEEEKMFNVVIKKDYPYPIISHKQSREKAIKAYEKSKEIYRKKTENKKMEFSD